MVAVEKLPVFPSAGGICGKFELIFISIFSNINGILISKFMAAGKSTVFPAAGSGSNCGKLQLIFISIFSNILGILISKFMAAVGK